MDKFNIRMRFGMRDMVADIARTFHRSQNSQFLAFIGFGIKLCQQGYGHIIEHYLAHGEIHGLGSEEFRPHVGDPVMHDGQPWIVQEFNVHMGMINAVLEVEDPSTDHGKITKAVRYSELKPLDLSKI